MMKKNDIINLEINSITNLGFGVGRHEGMVVFVSGAVTGDAAEVKIIKITPSYTVGRVEKFTRLSKIRDVDRCKNTPCLSCAYKSISYEHEKEIKALDVKEAFIKAGLPEVKISPLVASPRCENYRNKAQYPISVDKSGNYTVGFYAPKSHRVTEARRCPLAPTVFGDIIDTLTAFFKKHAISVYNEENGTGLLRHIYLRRGEISGEILLTLVINGDTLPRSQELVKTLTYSFGDIVGILLNVNKKRTNVILGSSFRTLYGRDYIYDTLGGVKLKITAPSFYQVNHDAAELLYAKAKELAMPTKLDTVLDLFCGTGSIGLSMAADAGEVLGIEIIESAVLCARENAEMNSFSNAKFYTGDATDTEKLLDNAEKELQRKIDPTVIVLDPPRAGCDERLINYVASLSPKRIVYISCNPTTLARDCAVFKKLGFVLGEVTPFDLFPMTGHVETIVCLDKK
jgi:23S rRNA (uracil1939-C5)-methyltransferase